VSFSLLKKNFFKKIYEPKDLNIRCFIYIFGDNVVNEIDEALNEMLNAIRHINKAFSENDITSREVYLALPTLIMSLFKYLHYDNLEKQKKFFEDLEEVVLNMPNIIDALHSKGLI